MAGRWSKRRLVVTFVFLGVCFLFYQQQLPGAESLTSSSRPAAAVQPRPQSPASADDGRFHWLQVKLLNPVAPEKMRPVPSPSREMLRAIPKIQHEFVPETEAARKVRLERLATVKSNFEHAWSGYKKNAWLSDEVAPLSGDAVDRFGGWAATLVDALDTLWMMDLKADFEEAVRAIDKIDFTTSTEEDVNVFETTIRYLGGFLAAYDLSEGRYPSLLQKAVELGDMLYVAFDTPNHMPIPRWKFAKAMKGESQPQPKAALVSEPGSLSLEFTRLSQITGNPKYYDAVQRVMDVFEAQQDDTRIPGLWPVTVNMERAHLSGGNGFTIGGMADSLYEYLPKEYLMLGGAKTQYRDMYLKSLAAMDKHIFFRPRTKSANPILFPGDKTVSGNLEPSAIPIVPRVQHLSCFAGGMVGLGSRIFSRPVDMDTARQLVEGCIWAYENAPNGIMPEIMQVHPCPPDQAECVWDEKAWLSDVGKKARLSSSAQSSLNLKEMADELQLTPGVTRYDDTRYILRPEAIESVFILYRLTGDTTLMDRAWTMFEAIVAATKTNIAHAALRDCTSPDPRTSMLDSMESFWLAETLKYFYLIFSSPDFVSLDDYVLNTEAHPLKRPKSH